MSAALEPRAAFSREAVDPEQAILKMGKVRLNLNDRQTWISIRGVRLA